MRCGDRTLRGTQNVSGICVVSFNSLAAISSANICSLGLLLGRAPILKTRATSRRHFAPTRQARRNTFQGRRFLVGEERPNKVGQHMRASDTSSRIARTWRWGGADANDGRCAAEWLECTRVAVPTYHRLRVMVTERTL